MHLAAVVDVPDHVDDGGEDEEDHGAGGDAPDVVSTWGKEFASIIDMVDALEESGDTGKAGGGEEGVGGSKVEEEAGVGKDGEGDDDEEEVDEDEEDNAFLSYMMTQQPAGLQNAHEKLTQLEKHKEEANKKDLREILKCLVQCHCIFAE